MKDKVTLYIATHNITGKKYFGKTTKYFTQEDLQKYYHGSGTYWKRHLKKHGDDVTMEIYGICSLDKNSEDYVKPIALKFSEDNNIVEDYNTWANHTKEDGFDGGFRPTSNETRLKISEGNKGKTRTEEFKQNVSLVHKNKKLSSKTKDKISSTLLNKTTEEKLIISNKISRSLKGKKQSKESIEKRRISNIGRRHSEESLQKMRKPKGPQEKIICPHCNKEGGKGSMKRYHFDNCKFKLELSIT